MPKGVEHISQVGDFGHLRAVSSSVMPKGVEHSREVSCGLGVAAVCRVQ